METIIFLIKFFNKSKQFIVLPLLIVGSMIVVHMRNEQTAQQLRQDERSQIAKLENHLSTLIHFEQEIGIPDQERYDIFTTTYHKASELNDLKNFENPQLHSELYQLLLDNYETIQPQLSQSTLHYYQEWNERMATAHVQRMYPNAPMDATLLLLQTAPWFGVILMVLLLVEHYYIRHYFYKEHRGLLVTQPLTTRRYQVANTVFLFLLAGICIFTFGAMWFCIHQFYNLPIQWSFPVKDWNDQWSTVRRELRLIIPIVFVGISVEICCLSTIFSSFQRK